LAPHFTAAIFSRAFDEAFGAVETDRFVTEITKNFQISPGTAAEIEYPKRSGAVKDLQQRVAILADVVIARAFPKTLGMLIIM